MNGAKRNRLSALLLVLLIGALITMVGCQSLKGPKRHWYEFWKKREEPRSSSIYPVEPAVAPPEAQEGKELGEISPLPIEPAEIRVAPSELESPEPPTIRMQAGMEVAELKTVYFDFDKAELRSDAIATLENNLQWILQHPGVHILIEGHCDERGTPEYNLNLGQRRANSVKEYLIQKGVDANFLHTISYGEERPADPGHSEEAWGKNRRAQFLVY